MSRSKAFIICTVSLLILQVLTILCSWIVSAVEPSLKIHSLLSGYGLRWLLSSLPENLNDRYFICMLLFCIFSGPLVKSKLPKKLILFSENDFRERLGLYLFLIIVCIGLTTCIVIAFYPHSSFLGVTGHLYPGPFIGSILLVMGMSVFVGSVVFLLFSGSVKNWNDAENTLLFGIKSAAPLIVIYFLLKELVEMFLFVL